MREYATARTRGRLLRISPAWQAWAFWVLLAALLGGIAFVSLVPVDDWVTGRAVVQDVAARRIVAAFPAAERQALRVGMPILFRFADRDEPLRMEVGAIDPDILGPASVRTRVGPQAELLGANGPVVLVYATFPAQDTTLVAGQSGAAETLVAGQSGAAETLVAGQSGTAEILVGRRTLLSAFRPGRRE
jgi:hypothetical protein